MSSEKPLPDSMPPGFECAYLINSTKAGPRARPLCGHPGNWGEAGMGSVSCFPGSLNVCANSLPQESSGDLPPADEC